jgi:DNA segregation ATPase FtsK/SpoIIIE, S-DNA-T family
MASRRSKRRRARKAWWPRLDLPQLEQRHLDLIGLGLVAFAAFFACVFYLGWAGGEVGEALAGALRFLFGAVAYGVPVALLAAGVLLIMRPALPSTHPFTTGALCLAAALTLGFAAGTLGLGPGSTPREDFLDPAYLEEHGGLTGESILWASSKLFSEVGSHILFVFLLLAAVLLLTGASIAGLASRTRIVAAGTSERMRRTADTLNLPTERLPSLAPEPKPVEPPEPEDREPVVRATHVEVPALDAASRYPDI